MGKQEEKEVTTTKKWFQMLLAGYLAVGLLTLGGCRSISEGNPSLSSSMGQYEPQSSKSSNILPSHIRQRLNDYLVGRLGERFLAKLTLAQCFVVNLEDLYEAEPRARNWQWQVPAYACSYKYSNRKKGLKAYYTQVWLDESGTIIRGIQLPEVSKAPEKADLISLKQAIKVASDSGFPKEIQNIRFGYSEEADSLIWEMSYTVSSEDYVSVDRVLEVDAHNGKVVRVYRQGGIH